VPGSIDAWCRLSADYGSKPLSEVLAAAIDAADNGFRITPRIAADWAVFRARVENLPDTAAQFLPHGDVPAIGDKRAQPSLAAPPAGRLNSNP
jgi:gamma-glutamyltranspeptidase/glutathione hydrolase